MLSDYPLLMRKSIEIPSAAAGAFVNDMRAFHAAKTGFEKDEIAARQLHALREHLPRGARPKLTDEHEMFLAMEGSSVKDQCTYCCYFRWC